MTEDDRRLWNERYLRVGPAPIGAIGPPPIFAQYEDLFPTDGRAMELACGRGRCAVWLAARGMEVWGLDVSSVAVDMARELAERSGLGGRCKFEVVDLDGGLPEGPPVDLILSYFFWDPRLDRTVIDRLVPGGMLAVAVVSMVDVGPGPFRVGPGALRTAFGELDVIVDGERAGETWLLAKA